MTLVSYCIAALWLGSLALALLASAARKERGFRKSHMAALVLSLAFMVSWSLELLGTKQPEPAGPSHTPRTSKATCASVMAGESTDKVRDRLGEPNEERDESELRGPGAKVWIYRDLRCAVLFLEGSVESIE